jgi:catechol 2,3-dioxygenase-like lactoylglutathione lyase family enzyme
MDVRKFQVVLIAEDFDRTTAFYRDVLGLPVSYSWDRPGGRGVYFQCGDGFIEVLDERSAEHVAMLEHDELVPLSPKLMRIGVQVEDVDSLHARLREVGQDPTPPVDVPWGHRSFRVADPDGVVLTFYAERTGGTADGGG